MADDDYVSPYSIIDDRLRSSVMAAQRGNRSIHEVHQRNFGPGRAHNSASFEPEFNDGPFSSTLDTITLVIECMCFAGTVGWDEKQRLVPARPRLGGLHPPRVILRDDRATLSLYDPLESLEALLAQYLQGLENWTIKIKYFKEVALPLFVRTISYSISEASTARVLRKELNYVGPIDRMYVNSFQRMSDSMEEPMLELRALSDFIASILNEGDEIFPAGSGNDSPPATSTPPKSSSLNPSSPHATEILNTDAEVSNSRQHIETKSASALPTSSSHFNTIPNPEPAPQASASGLMNTESTTSQRVGFNAFEDLMEVAGYGSAMDQKSPSSKSEPERQSTPDPQHPSSPGYSPPPSPVLSVDDIVKPFAVSSIRAPEPSPDTSSSILLQPGSLYQSKPSPAPPGTPNWKIELSERKGHRISLLHVGPRELDILAKCLTLVHKAMETGEACVCAVIEKNDLAIEMEKEYKQWNEICTDLEDNVSIDKEEAREKAEKIREFATQCRDDDDDDDDDGVGDDKVTSKSKGKAKDPAIYGPPPTYESHRDWFGTANPRDTRRSSPGDAGRPDADGRDYDDGDSEDETGGGRGGPRDFGLGPASPAGGWMGSRVLGEVGDSEDSEGTQGVEVMGFEEEFGGGEDGDEEMADVGEGEGEGGGGGGGSEMEEGSEPGEIAEGDEGKDQGGASGNADAGAVRSGQKGFRSGGRIIGLYGEEL